jgi:hypothetical protein
MVTIKKNKSFLWFLLPLLLLVVIFGFLYKEKYLRCLSKDFTLCITSKKYVSASGKFTFRYPKDYPVTFKTGNEMVSQYNFDNKYGEWVNFSSEFYPNAGGDRLGSIIVEKNSSYQSVNQFGDKTLSDFDKLPEQYKGTPPKIEYLKIGGVNAVRSPPSDDYVLVHNGELYRIGFDYNDYYHKLPIEHYQKGKELILSTFTFNQ